MGPGFSKKIDEITIVPPFLRFYQVALSYHRALSSIPIEKGCEFIERNLLPLKSALMDSVTIEFSANIDQNNRGDFINHSQLLDYIQNRLLPICHSSRGYRFCIKFKSDTDSDANVIASLLQMSELKSYLNIEIKILPREQERRLPIEAISNWLEKSVDGTECVDKKERFLKIFTYGAQNTREMVDNLATVCFI